MERAVTVKIRVTCRVFIESMVLLGLKMNISIALGTRRMAANILPVASVGKKSAKRRTARIDAEKAYKVLLFVIAVLLLLKFNGFVTPKKLKWN